ncbi:GMC family oxidoreductase [Paenibacillus sp. HN-1]|nr:GMC family oxidoreductase [Paenibacillus sp. CGMCC 1.18879]MBY9084635.1 GMC family oxidoreductase [Paenibacillus sinensis]
MNINLPSPNPLPASQPEHSKTIHSPVSRLEWIPLTSLEQMSQTEYDVLIVGTGAGGGAVLWRLCEQWGNNGKRIGVVEAGDALLPTNLLNVETMNQQRYLDIAYRDPQFAIPVPGTRLRQVIALGGRMLKWSVLSPRMYAASSPDWPVPEREMELYYSIAEQAMGVTNGYTKGSPINQIFLNRLWNSGYDEAMNEPMAVDLESTKYGEIHSNVFFSSIAFLAQALNRRSYDLAVLARALRVMTERGRAKGVQVMTPDKRSFELKAKNVVLCASTIETPRILYHSGIQGRAIGHYLTNHSNAIGKASFNHEDYPYVLGAIGILIPETGERPYQVQIEGPMDYRFYHDRQIPFKGQMEMHIIGVGNVESRYENQILFNPNVRDQYGMPEAQIQLTYNEADLMVQGQAEEAVKHVSSILHTPMVSLDLQEALAGDHESGTCRMGCDPDTSGTNPYGKVHGISGLYVADNSVLPFLGSANPTLTTVALAMRTADYIVRTSSR